MREEGRRLVGPVLVVIWLVIVLPALVFGGGYLASVALNYAVQRLSSRWNSPSEY